VVGREGALRRNVDVRRVNAIEGCLYDECAGSADCADRDYPD
jgi:hypothetical protein